MARVLYLTTIPPPAIPGTEAVLQTINHLMSDHDSAHLSLFPFRHPSRWVPARMMGWRQQQQLIRMSAEADIIHVFDATLRPLACLNRLSRPIIYTVSATIGKHLPVRWLRQRDITVVTNNKRDHKRLSDIDGLRTTMIRPGLDLSRFTYQPPPAGNTFRLLVGSAPWTRAQFRTKGIDALIAAAQQIPWLHLVFLWRNHWLPQLEQRLDCARIRDRTTIHNTHMDVNAVLADCHATTVLAAHDRLVKAWPHSAIESMAAGKPVLLSRTIAMSDYVEQQHAGICIPTMETATVRSAITALQTGSNIAAGDTLATTTQREFALPAMRNAYQALYDLA